MKIRLKVPKKNEEIYDSSHILANNQQILSELEKYQEEINYKVSDNVDYIKNVQRTLLDQSLFNQISIQKKSSIFPIQLTRTIYPSILDENVSLIMSQLKIMDFHTSRSLIQIIFDKLMKNDKNYSSFIETIVIFFDDNTVNSWEDVDIKYGSNVVFYLLFLLINSSNNFTMYISENEIGSSYMFKRSIKLTHDGLFNFWQQLNYDNSIIKNVPFISGDPKCEYNFNVYLVFDSKVKKTSLSGGYQIVDVISGFKLLFHQPTLCFLNERKHDYIYNHLYIYLITFDAFLQKKNVSESMRYLLAGSVIKSAYNVRDCADVDFLVLDHCNNIKDFFPDIGIRGIFDDFGKTYYGNEEYYFPMIPEMYIKQKEMKEKITMTEHNNDNEPLSILTNFPKYSVSGLKAGRYIDIFSGEAKKIGFNIRNMDDLVSDPANRVYFLGCPVIQLKLEMIRDNIKDIDLGRVSKKQLHDFHFLKKNYGFLFNHKDTIEFLFDRFDKKCNIRQKKICLNLNCYHSPLLSDTKVGYDLVIRRTPLYIQSVVKILIDECPLLTSCENDLKEYDFRQIYQYPLLSSLPASMKMNGQFIDVSYYYELSNNGELKIYINPDHSDISLFRDVCITGHIQIEINENTKRFLISVDGNKMKKIYSQFSKIEYRKEYRMRMIVFMRNLIQIHKMVDCHTKEKISVDILR